MCNISNVGNASNESKFSNEGNFSCKASNKKKKGKRIYKLLKISVMRVKSSTSIKKKPFADVLQNRCS